MGYDSLSLGLLRLQRSRYNLQGKYENKEHASMSATFIIPYAGSYDYNVNPVHTF